MARLDLSDLDASSLNLRVVESSLQAVIFWVDDEAAKAVPDSVRRVFLIAGDSSMGVDLPQKSPMRSRVLVAWVGGGIGLWGIALILRRVLKRRVRVLMGAPGDGAVSGCGDFDF